MRTLILTALKSCLLACVLCVTSVTVALASDSWAELKQLLYKDKTIAKTSNEVILTAPYRATDDRRVPIDIKVQVISIICKYTPCCCGIRIKYSQPSHILIIYWS